jgi:hypothetical protein
MATWNDIRPALSLHYWWSRTTHAVRRAVRRVFRPVRCLHGVAENKPCPECKQWLKIVCEDIAQ